MGEHVYVYVCIDVSVSLNRAIYVSIYREIKIELKKQCFCEAILKTKNFN